MDILLVFLVVASMLVMAGAMVYIAMLLRKKFSSEKKRIKINYVTYKAHIGHDARVPLPTHFPNSEDGIDFEKNVTRIWVEMAGRPHPVKGFVRGSLLLPPDQKYFRVRICSTGHDNNLGYHCKLVED